MLCVWNNIHSILLGIDIFSFPLCHTLLFAELQPPAPAPRSPACRLILAHNWLAYREELTCI